MIAPTISSQADLIRGSTVPAAGSCLVDPRVKPGDNDLEGWSG
jgi:hypothetical protein